MILSPLVKKTSFDIGRCSIRVRRVGVGDDDDEPPYEQLNSLKKQISFYYRNRSWDSAKKLTNAYELVATSPMPVSRSFFKLYEILSDFETKIEHFSGSQIEDMRCLFLAEGPGGFVEAFETFCASRRHRSPGGGTRRLFCNTLIDKCSRTVPCWKIPTVRMNADAVVFCDGVDGTGNIYSIDNIDSIVSKVGGQGTVHLVTADGGFDFSDDFDSQEINALQLIVAEAYAAMLALSAGGTFVLKMFDVSLQRTLIVMQLISSAFASTHVMKPMTSRQANSEKYMVLMGYTRDEEVLKILRDCVASFSTDPLDDVRVDREFERKVKTANKDIVDAQIRNISKTIAFLNVQPSSLVLGEIASNQKRRAAAWSAHFFQTKRP